MQTHDLNIVVDTSVSTFLNECGPLLYQNEAMNSLMLGLLEGLKTQSPAVQPLLVRILENGKIVSVAVSFRKQPMNIILTYASDTHLRFLAEHLQKTGEVFTGVVGPKIESEKFAQIWKECSGKNFELAMDQKIYQIDRVEFPQDIIGEMRVAEIQDTDLVFEWIKAFTQESLPGDKRTDQQWKEFAVNVTRKQGVYLWVQNEKPVSMAVASRSTRNGVSITGVYTPPVNRKKGYASAVVASLSQKMLDQGKRFCVLYTDLANPTSNKIYQKIGYREVAASMHFNFIE